MSSGMFLPDFVAPVVENRFLRLDMRPCIVVDIPPEEYRVCTNFASEMWANSKEGTYGEGLISTEDDPYKTCRIGNLGQMAFGKIFHQPVDTVYRRGGDKYDNKIDNVTIDVKCATKNSGTGYILHVTERGKTIPLDKDVYVFSYVESEDRDEERARVVIIGFMTKGGVAACEVKRGYRGGCHMNYEVPFDATLPIEKLLALKKRYVG